MQIALYMQRTRKYLDRHGCCWNALRKLVNAVETGKQRRERYQGRLLRNHSQAARLLTTDRVRFMAKYGVDAPQPQQHDFMGDLCFAMNPLQNLDSKLRPCSRTRRVTREGSHRTTGMHGAAASVAAAQRSRSQSLFGDSGGAVNPLFSPQTSSRQLQQRDMQDSETSQRLCEQESAEDTGDRPSALQVAMPSKSVRRAKQRSRSLCIQHQPTQPLASAEPVPSLQALLQRTVRARRSSILSRSITSRASCSPNLSESPDPSDSDAGWSSDSSAEAFEHKQLAGAQTYRAPAQKATEKSTTPKPVTKRLKRHSIHTSTVGSTGLSIVQLAQTYGPLGKCGMGTVTKAAAARQESNRRLLLQASSRRLLVSAARDSAATTTTSSAMTTLASSSDMAAVRRQLRALAGGESAARPPCDSATQSTLPGVEPVRNQFAVHHEPTLSPAALSIAVALMQPKSPSTRSKGHFADRSALVPSENELMFAFGKR